MAEIPRIASIIPLTPLSPHAMRVHKSDDSPDHHDQNQEQKHDSVQIEDEDITVIQTQVHVLDDDHLDISA